MYASTCHHLYFVSETIAGLRIVTPRWTVGLTHVGQVCLYFRDTGDISLQLGVLLRKSEKCKYKIGANIIRRGYEVEPGVWASGSATVGRSRVFSHCVAAHRIPECDAVVRNL
jgi:hypothetical protein